MTWRAWVRATLLGVTVAEAVVLAHSGPRWRRPLAEHDGLLGFSADGRTAITAGDAAGQSLPHVTAYDTRTGETRAVTLAAPPARGIGREFVLTHDGRGVLVWDRAAKNEPGIDHAAHSTAYPHAVHDAATGGMIGEPFAGLPAARVLAVSPDGRWLASRAVWHPPELDDSLARTELQALPGGAAVARLDERGDSWVSGVAFAADGRAAVLWHTRDPDDQGPPRYVVDLYALPAARRARRIELSPTHRVWALGRLDGERLTVLAFDATPRPDTPVVTFDLHTDPPRPTELLMPPFRYDRDVRTVGPGWVAVERERPDTPTVPDRLRAAVAGWLGRPPRRSPRWSDLTLFHVDGRPRAEIAGGLPSGATVDPTGRWAATLDGWGGLALYDFQQPSPWPTALGTGAAVGVAWAWLERRRARRASG